MAVSVFKTFSAGEVLTASDLNSSFTKLTDNGEDLGWPATKAKDLDGNELIMDADGDSSIHADTSDQFDFKMGGTDIFKMDTTAFWTTAAFPKLYLKDNTATVSTGGWQAQIIWFSSSDGEAAKVGFNTGGENFVISNINNSGGIIFTTGGAIDQGRWDEVGNFLIGGDVTPASSVGNLALFNGTIASDGPANGVCLYTKDVSSSAELHVVDEAANETLLSPHAFDFYQPDPADPLPWTYRSTNKYIGKSVNADISGALRALEGLTGQTFLHYENVPKADWATGKAEIARSAREAAVKKEMDVEIEVSARDGLEVVPRVDRELEIIFALKDGKIVQTISPQKRRIGNETRTKRGVRLDTKTGKLWRGKTYEEAEAVVPVAEKRPTPQWMIDRGVEQ